MYRQLLLLLITLFFSLSCTKSTIKIMPDYANKKFGPQDLAVIAMTDDVSIVNEDDMRDDLGEGEPKVIFTKLLKSLFPEKLKHYSRFKNVVLIDSLQIPNPRKTSLNIGKERKIYVTIPGAGEQVTVDSLTPDVIVFIDKITSLRDVQHHPGGFDANGNMQAGSSSSSLQYKVAFVLWDNREGKIVSMGESVGEDGVFMAMTYKTWNKAFNGVARNILAKTPYYQPQVLPPPNTDLPNPLKKEERMMPIEE